MNDHVFTFCKSAAGKTHFNILPFGLNSEQVTINHSDFVGSYMFRFGLLTCQNSINVFINILATDFFFKF
jgi:hypothetical protein